MITLQTTCFEPLGTDCAACYSGLAWDGNLLYLTLPNCCQVRCYDACLHHKHCISTRRGYTSLCYDAHDLCFWALTDRESNHIYKLNCALQEIDCLSIGGNCHPCIGMTGVTCARAPEQLLIAYGGNLATVAKVDGAMPH
ncbi:MAG: hypothetical protein RR482_06340, partial [Clostridia bacterium]